MDIFENQVSYLKAVEPRLEQFIKKRNDLTQDVKNSLTVETVSDFVFEVKLKKSLKLQAIELSRDFSIILNELRSTLDAAVATIADQNGCTLDEYKKSKASFPIYKDEKDWGRAQKQLQQAKIPNNIIDLIKHSQPFNSFGTDPNTGENILILLNALNNHGKHSGHVAFSPILSFGPKKLELPDIVVDLFFNQDWGFDEAPLITIKSSRKINYPVFSPDFQIDFSCDEYKRINPEATILNSIGGVRACLETLRLGLYPEKRDFFGMPLIKI